MPIYDYKCQQHGLFHSLVAVDESGHAKPCPNCGALSARVIIMAPHITKMDAKTRRACECNERSQHAPRLSSQLLRPDSRMLKQSKTFVHADGTKMLFNQRPWMISH